VYYFFYLYQPFPADLSAVYWSLYIISCGFICSILISIYHFLRKFLRLWSGKENSSNTDRIFPADYCPTSLGNFRRWVSCGS